MPLRRKIKGALRRYLNLRNDNPRHWRAEWLPDWLDLVTESSVHPHDPVERADQFLAFDAGTTEIEVLNWLYATILLLKPRGILETGSWFGLGSLALASACKANGFGCVHSVELDQEACHKATAFIQDCGLSKWVQYHCEDSRTFLRNTQFSFEFGFFDSLCDIRVEECAICMKRGILHGPAVFHDTSPYRTRTLKEWPGEPVHSEYRTALRLLATEYFNDNFWENTLARGLTVLMPRTLPEN